MSLLASTNRRAKDAGTKPKGEWPGSVYNDCDDSHLVGVLR
jgi:hypothetical protein